MDSKHASILLLFFAVLGWVFIVVVLAEPKSHVKLSSSWGCGVFDCSSSDWNGNAKSYWNLCGDKAMQEATQAFGVMGVLLLSVTFVVHILQAIGQGGLIPSVMNPYVRFIHLGSALFITIMWILMIAQYAGRNDTSTYGRVTIRNSVCDPDINYGPFFGIVVMLTEIASYFLCGMGGSGGAGCQPLMG